MVPVGEEQPTSVPLHAHDRDGCLEAEAYGDASLAALGPTGPAIRRFGSSAPISQVDLAPSYAISNWFVPS